MEGSKTFACAVEIRSVLSVRWRTLPEPNLSILPSETTERLDQLLRKPATGKLVTTEHRRVVAQICVEARGAGIQVERLIVLLKDVLDKASRSENGTHSRTELRERLVSVCIEEYYRLDGNPTS